VEWIFTLSAALYLSPGAASSSRATSSGLSTTGSLRGLVAKFLVAGKPAKPGRPAGHPGIGTDRAKAFACGSPRYSGTNGTAPVFTTRARPAGPNGAKIKKGVSYYYEYRTLFGDQIALFPLGFPGTFVELDMGNRRQ
jgi:hypothetical protein